MNGIKHKSAEEIQDATEVKEYWKGRFKGFNGNVSNIFKKLKS